MKDLPKYDADIPDGHAFAAKGCRFRDDQKLRRFGFRIHSRRRGCEAVWELEGCFFKNSEALRLIREAEKKKEQEKRKE